MQVIRKFAFGRWYECRPGPKGVWYIHWTEERRSKRQTTRQKDLGAAQAFFDEWLGLVGAEKSDNPTISELWALKYPEETERVRAAWKSLRPTFGHLRPLDVTDALEQSYARKRGVAPSTIRLELSLLRSVWNHAVRKRWIASTDTPSLEALPEPSQPRERWFKDGEVEKLLAVAERYSRRAWAFIWLASETAARRTAIQELRWSQVDWEIGVIHFLPEGQKQTRKRRASVPISSALLPVLQRLYAERVDDYVIGSGARINEALRTIGERAGVSGVTPHVFRHTAATRMARNGVSLWVIARILGNTVEQVEKVYAKWQPGQHRDAVNLISGARETERGAQSERRTRPTTDDKGLLAAE